jgi:tRNA threonylcarbamoyladenosine biosynthesis protein TsaB
MAEILARAGWDPATVQLVAVARGPGSFTGLRIAVTAGKIFAYAVGARLVAINTLHVLMAQLPEDVEQACAVMDAQRRQLFAARGRRLPEGSWELVEDCLIVGRDELPRLLTPEAVLIGPVLERLGPEYLPGQPRADAEGWQPRAATVGRLAWEAHRAGRSDDPFALVPQYYRPSYAEEK